MPVNTPGIKVESVRKLGGTVELVGESYQETQVRGGVCCGAVGSVLGAQRVKAQCERGTTCVERPHAVACCEGAAALGSEKGASMWLACKGSGLLLLFPLAGSTGQNP